MWDYIRKHADAARVITDCSENIYTKLKTGWGRPPFENRCNFYVHEDKGPVACIFSEDDDELLEKNGWEHTGVNISEMIEILFRDYINLPTPGIGTSGKYVEDFIVNGDIDVKYVIELKLLFEDKNRLNSFLRTNYTNKYHGSINRTLSNKLYPIEEMKKYLHK